MSDFTDLVTLIARGGVVHPIITSAQSRFAHPNVVFLPIRDLARSSTALAWRRGASDPRRPAFIQIARKVAHIALEQMSARTMSEAATTS